MGVFMKREDIVKEYLKRFSEMTEDDMDTFRFIVDHEELLSQLVLKSLSGDQKEFMKYFQFCGMLKHLRKGKE